MGIFLVCIKCITILSTPSYKERYAFIRYYETYNHKTLTINTCKLVGKLLHLH